MISGQGAEIHKARPGRNNAYCAVCHQRVQRVSGGHGPVWVHKDTGAVVAHGADQEEDTQWTN